MKLMCFFMGGILSFTSQLVRSADVLLHQPTGPYFVTQMQHVFYSSPADDLPAYNGTDDASTLLVSIFAPTRSAPNHSVPYMDTINAEIWGSALGIVPAILSSLVIDIHQNGPPLSDLDFSTGTSPFPSILFLPGAGMPCFAYTAYLSELASHGYSVFALDHPGEPPYLQLPDRSSGVRSAFPPLYNWTFDDLQRIYTTRIRDAAALMRPASLSALVRRSGAPLNVSAFGVVGHSIGGAAAAGIMAQDPSLPLLAGANLDGWYFFNIGDLLGNGSSDAGVAAAAAASAYPDLAPRPFLELAKERPSEPDGTWANFSAAQSGWLRDVGVRGAGHFDFSDLPLWFDRLGQRGGAPRGGILGGIKGRRIAWIVTSFLERFFGSLNSKGLAWVDELVEDVPEAYVRESRGVTVERKSEL